MAFVTAINDRGVTFVAHDITPVDLVTPRPTFRLSALATTGSKSRSRTRPTELVRRVLMSARCCASLMKMGLATREEGVGIVLLCAVAIL